MADAQVSLTVRRPLGSGPLETLGQQIKDFLCVVKTFCVWYVLQNFRFYGIFGPVIGLTESWRQTDPLPPSIEVLTRDYPTNEESTQCFRFTSTDVEEGRSTDSVYYPRCKFHPLM